MLETEKAAKIMQKMKERDRLSLKHWTPYSGPPDRDFAVLNAPKQEVQEEVGQAEKISPR